MRVTCIYLNMWFPVGSYLGRIRRRGLVAGGLSLGVDLRFQKPIHISLILCSSIL